MSILKLKNRLINLLILLRKKLCSNQGIEDNTFATEQKNKSIIQDEGFIIDHEYSSYSQSGEDKIINHLMFWLGCEQITYLDIGAHDPILMSNTYYFYTKGHRGILVEPDIDWCKKIQITRPDDKILNVAVSSADDSATSMYVMSSRSLNTLDKKQAEMLSLRMGERIEEVREVRQLGINQILEENFKSSAPDLVSLDIEGMDFIILQAWDFNKFRPKVFCVETVTYSVDNTEIRVKEIIDFMISQRYQVYADTYLNTIFVCQEAWQKRPISDKCLSSDYSDEVDQ